MLQSGLLEKKMALDGDVWAMSRLSILSSIPKFKIQQGPTAPPLFMHPPIGA